MWRRRVPQNRQVPGAGDAWRLVEGVLHGDIGVEAGGGGGHRVDRYRGVRGQAVEGAVGTGPFGNFINENRIRRPQVRGGGVGPVVAARGRARLEVLGQRVALGVGERLAEQRGADELAVLVDERFGVIALFLAAHGDIVRADDLVAADHEQDGEHNEPDHEQHVANVCHLHPPCLSQSVAVFRETSGQI